MASQCLGKRLHPSQAPTLSQPSKHTAGRHCGGALMSLSLNVPTCQMAIGVPHRATVKMKPTKSAFKLYPKSVYASLHLCLYLVQPQDLPGPSQPPPLPVRPPTAATKGRLEHLSQMVSPSSAHSPPGLEPQWGKSPSLTRGPQGPPFLPLSPELTCSSHKGPLADPPMN